MTGRQEETIKVLPDAVVIFREAADASGEADALVLLAGSNLKLGHIQKAKESAEAAWELFSQSGNDVGMKLAESVLEAVVVPEPTAAAGGPALQALPTTA